MSYLRLNKTSGMGEGYVSYEGRSNEQSDDVRYAYYKTKDNLKYFNKLSEKEKRQRIRVNYAILMTKE